MGNEEVETGRLLVGCWWLDEVGNDFNILSTFGLVPVHLFVCFFLWQIFIQWLVVCGIRKKKTFSTIQARSVLRCGISNISFIILPG